MVSKAWVSFIRNTKITYLKIISQKNQTGNDFPWILRISFGKAKTTATISSKKGEKSDQTRCFKNDGEIWPFQKRKEIKQSGADESSPGREALAYLKKMPYNKRDNLVTPERVKIMKNPVVTMKINGEDTIRIELYPKVAPNTVNNFISLVKKGYYNGLTFHRIIRGFMIQGGCPEGTGIGGPGYTIRGEFSHNGVKNDLNHTPGVISMARTMMPNSAGSQFFIMHAAAPHLDGDYAAFGKVIEGMDVVDKLACVATDPRSDMPLEPQVMTEVTVETFGQDYPEPEKM